ncbi:MAG: NAD(P)/FAD-dependent oxidoreductase [Thermoanaerobaculia bacterium]
MSDSPRRKVLIVGGGFGGIYTALELDKWLFRYPDVDVTLVNRENFFLFTPLLHEVAASDLDITNIVSPVRKLVKHVQFFEGDVEAIDMTARRVAVSHGDGHTHELSYDHLVLSLGSVTNFLGMPGLQQRSITMKSLGDAITLRNRMIGLLEEAETECGSPALNRLMTFVVAGGGFAGVETIGGINDFIHQALRFYPHIPAERVRMVLVHPGAVILPELSEKLGRYAQQKLAERGVEVRLNTKVTAVTSSTVSLSDGSVIEAATLIWTAGTQPNPLIQTLPSERERGRIRVDEALRVPGYPGVWALGDCALVPDPLTGGFHPPTAQHAIRQGKVVARNILSDLRGEEGEPFRFRTIGQLASLGRRTGVAQILGIHFSGFIAWWLWRTIYLLKLPRLEKKVRVALDWTWDLLFSKDLVKFLSRHDEAEAHREQGSPEAIRAAM